MIVAVHDTIHFNHIWSDSLDLAQIDHCYPTGSDVEYLMERRGGLMD